MSRRGGARPLWPDLRDRSPIDVVGLGESSIDRICRFDGPLTLGARLPMLDCAVRPGGTVATALLACARLGLRATFLGSVGEDAPAGGVLEPLREAGVDVSHVKRVSGALTRTAVILVDQRSGERTVLWHRDPRLRMCAEHLSTEAIERARSLLLDPEDAEAALWAARTARRAGIPVVLDADAPSPSMETLLAQVDFPIVSQAFAEKFSQTGSLGDALRRLVQLGARLAVITLGARGALARQGEREIASPPFPITPTDTTGAGDVFRAGFLWGLLEGCDAEAALRRANGAAALACLGHGAQGSLPTRKQLEAWIRSTPPGVTRAPKEP